MKPQFSWRRRLAGVAIALLMIAIFIAIEEWQAAQCRADGGHWQRTGIGQGCHGDGKGFY
ncbi:hypothetical protein [Croceicoccus mobilis]|uniref:Uncharacterized protein n=1 Tax=Croceicoccus mobilis TaxID=1703339 RepID=A0A916YT69_9SPHN|nr:hypothetical protein [Croceicoccus mobilis]GGD58871.1 hypothetical protein GCM10010990_05210 [Croceicoccus mobilis]